MAKHQLGRTRILVIGTPACLAILLGLEKARGPPYDDAQIGVQGA